VESRVLEPRTTVPQVIMVDGRRRSVKSIMREVLDPHREQLQVWQGTSGGLTTMGGGQTTNL
jgi:hypothetical protein